MRSSALSEQNKTEYFYTSEVKFVCEDENAFLNYDGKFVDEFRSECLSDKTWKDLNKVKCYTG